MNNYIVTRLRDCTCVPHGELCREAADEIERLRKERDEARRQLCSWEADRSRIVESSIDVANRYGWDCFKENKHLQTDRNNLEIRISSYDRERIGLE